MMKKSVPFWVALCCSVGFVQAAEPALDTLIAHRGESADAPENTLPAYRMAVARGFGFECDIYQSKDGRLFTFHDSTLKRTTSGVNTNRCVDVDWKTTVSRVNVAGWGQWKGSKYDPTSPASLEDVLALARPGRKIYIEVKGGDAAVDWVDNIRTVFENEPKATPETVLFICFSEKTCAALKRRMPAFKVFWLTAEKLTAEAVIGKLRHHGLDGVDVCYRPELHTPEYIQAVRKTGLEFHVWTIDNPERAQEAFSRGAQTVTTNRAKYILDAVSQK